MHAGMLNSLQRTRSPFETDGRDGTGDWVKNPVFIESKRNAGGPIDFGSKEFTERNLSTYKDTFNCIVSSASLCALLGVSGVVFLDAIFGAYFLNLEWMLALGVGLFMLFLSCFAKLYTLMREYHAEVCAE